MLPLWGPDDSFHLNPMLLQNLIKSSYFQKCCRDLTDWSALVDEIYYQVQHVEPFSAGTLFHGCVLYMAMYEWCFRFALSTVH